MKNKFIHIVFVCVALLSFTQILAQSEGAKDTLDTQLVKVVKPYTPKISDAFKIKQFPSLEHHNNSKKRPVEYTIFSVPVASVFSPAKSKSVGLEQLKREKKFSNIAIISAGNYMNLQGDLFLNSSISKGKNLEAYLGHHSSQGGIKDLFLDDDFSTSRALLKYEVSNREKYWNLEAGVQRSASNWYGLFPDFETHQQQPFDVKQVVSIVEAKSSLNLNESIFDATDAQFYFLKDDFDSKEMRGQLDSNLNLDLFHTPITTNIGFDMLSGTFAQNFSQSTPLNYENFTAFIAPSHTLNFSNFNINIGFKTVYFNDFEHAKQKFYVYPKIKTSAAIVNSILIAYAGIDGDLIQNTYKDLYLENSFVSPTLNIKPTSMSYKLFFGTKGKLSNSLSYDISGAFSQQNDAVFFQKNWHSGAYNSMGYANGNSFGLVYDDLQTVSIQGVLNFELNDQFNFSGSATFNSFNLDTEENAWNLPEIESTLSMRYHPTDRLFFGVQGYFTGKRYDFQKFESSTITNANFDKIISLDAFFDLNIDATYAIDNRWSARLELNNILGKNYQRWMHFPVQGLQISAAAFYKFDL